MAGFFSNARAQTSKLYTGIKNSGIAQSSRVIAKDVAENIQNNAIVNSAKENLIHKGLKEEAQDEIIKKRLLKNDKNYRDTLKVADSIDSSYEYKSLTSDDIVKNFRNVKDYINGNADGLNINVGSDGVAGGAEMLKNSIAKQVAYENGLTKNLSREQIERFAKEKSSILQGEATLKTAPSMIQQYYTAPVVAMQKANAIGSEEAKRAAMTMGAYRYGATAGVIGAGVAIANGRENTSRL